MLNDLHHPAQGGLRRTRTIAPLITSKRRTSAGGSSLWSSLDTKRSSKSDRQNAPSRNAGEGEVGTALTIFYTIAEAKIVIESWRRHFNTVCPHGSLGYKPPAPEVFVPAMTARAAAQPGPATPHALAARPTLH